ncbi:MAG TPA: GFA family protein [Xanthomonadaceae bacterium]|jgi:hypothetical protein|nr:GFA family protein [Xanthomonadaceae bacterium]
MREEVSGAIVRCGPHGRFAQALGITQGDMEMFRGSCLCGKVSYEVRGSPESMYYCHCGMCRKATGSSFATNMLVQETDFVVTSGQALIKAFQSSPGEYRHFCSECGSPIYGKALIREGKVSVRCGALDDDPLMRPTIHIYTASKAPWTSICDQLPQFAEAPEP